MRRIWTLNPLVLVRPLLCVRKHLETHFPIRPSGCTRKGFGFLTETSVRPHVAPVHPLLVFQQQLTSHEP